jgi:transposase InsO family protein
MERQPRKPAKKRRSPNRLITADRRNNGPDFVAKELRKWLGQVGTETLYLEPGSPEENGYCESFNGKLPDECLNGRFSTR